MTAQSQETRVEYHPRFLATEPLRDTYELVLNTRLLGRVATLYGLEPDEVNPVEIVATHERAMTWSRDARQSSGEKLGHFERVVFETADGELEEEHFIKIYVTPHVSASMLGIELFSQTTGWEGDPQLLGTNLSATLVHELGHVAAHTHRAKQSSGRPSTLRGRWEKRRSGHAAVDESAEEPWVVACTARFMSKNPIFRNLLTASKK